MGLKIENKFNRPLIILSSANIKKIQNFENLAREKNVESVDLVKRFPTVLQLQESASIPLKTSRFNFQFGI